MFAKHSTTQRGMATVNVKCWKILTETNKNKIYDGWIFEGCSQYSMIRIYSFKQNNVKKRRRKKRGETDKCGCDGVQVSQKGIRIKQWDVLYTMILSVAAPPAGWMGIRECEPDRDETLRGPNVIYILCLCRDMHSCFFDAFKCAFCAIIYIHLYFSVVQLCPLLLNRVFLIFLNFFSLLFRLFHC